MALTYATALQNQIALRLSNRLYANLDTPDQTAIDGVNNGSTSPPTAGHAYDAWVVLQKYNNFLQVTDPSTTIPAEWTQWFIAEVVYHASTHIQPDRAKEFREQRDDAMRRAISTYTKTDHDDTAGTEAWVVNTYASCRKYVLERCVHLTPMLLPTPERIDSALRARLVRLWEMADWSFRRELITLTISTAAAVTDDVSTGFEIDKLASKRIYFSDSNGEGVAMESVSATEMAYLKSLNTAAGRPRYFRLTKSGSTLTWSFDRTPDTAYTAKCEALITIPALATQANFTSALAKLPADMLDILRDAAAADVIYEYGHPLGRDMYAKAEESWAKLLAEIDDVSNADEIRGEYGSRGVVVQMMEGQDHYHNIIGGFN